MLALYSSQVLALKVISFSFKALLMCEVLSFSFKALLIYIVLIVKC